MSFNIQPHRDKHVFPSARYSGYAIQEIGGHGIPVYKIQVDNIPVVEKRRVILDLTGHRVDRNDRDKIDFMFVYYMARLCV